MPRTSSVAAALLAVSVSTAVYVGSQSPNLGEVEVTGPIHTGEDGGTAPVDSTDASVPTTEYVSEPPSGASIPASLPFDDGDSVADDVSPAPLRGTAPVADSSSTAGAPRPTDTAKDSDGDVVIPQPPTTGPGALVTEPSTASPSTAAPTSATSGPVRPPSTTPSVPDQPVTTAPVATTAAPATNVPTTQPPSTAAPTTIAPSTIVSTTIAFMPGAPSTSAAPRPPVPSSQSVLFGPWIEEQHLDEVYGRFTSAQLNVTTKEVLDVLAGARATNSRIYLQLGSEGQYGVNFADRSESRWTMSKWKNAIDGFAQNATYRAAIQDAIDDGTIASVYLIDEPKLESHWGTRISNSDIDEMARYVESYWPNASTTVRASARTMELAEPASTYYDWKYLDNNWIMINHSKWAKNGDRTLEGFFEREVKAANNQGLGTIFSHQLIIGDPANPRLGVDCPHAPTSPQADECSSKASSGNRNAMSPVELRTYTEAMLATRNVNGVRSASGDRVACAVLIFRWDRNGETLWENPRYDAVADELNRTAGSTPAAECGNRNTGPGNSSQDKRE